jgi:hypothetical protein
MLNFDALSGGGDGSTEIIEPRQIFTTLVRNSRFKFPSANQGEVLDKWFERRTQPDNTIKMNTGSGKMLVGLLTLKSCLNEKVGPAVYVTPDNYLVRQVLQEAKDLGIDATEDTESADFLAGTSVLVINIDKLVNGKSVFGVGKTNINIGSLVIDDAHACLDAVADQFSIDLSVSHPAYEKLFELFSDDLKAHSQIGWIEVSNQDPQGLMAVPFWAWQSKSEQVLQILHSNRDSDGLKFSWPLLKDVISLCTCVFSGNALQIKPRCLPIDQIPSLSKSKRKIYMTATLADDGILITHLKADAKSVSDPIRPKGVGEIGDRMIIAPQEVNPDITDEDIKLLATDIAKKHNVVVLVPSFSRSTFWQNVSAQSLHKDNIAAGLTKLKSGHVGLSVLINRYDGVDLPEEACRLLIIDGLPESYGLVDRIEANALEGTELQLLRNIQRIEQGMGRGVRSGEDRCAVLLMGARLTQRINLPEARKMFTPATMAQIEMGKEITRQIKGKPVNELHPILDLCIERDGVDGQRWWQAGRSRLAKTPEGVASRIDTNVIHIRKAFDLATKKQWSAAIGELQIAVNTEKQPNVRGYLKQQLAEYVNYVNPVESQTLLLSGFSENSGILRPLQGIKYTKIPTSTMSQAQASEQFIRSRFIESNSLIYFTNALLNDLSWNPERTDKFESAIQELGLLLGFGSQRPDKMYKNGGPDNLWAVGGLKYYVIECKSGVNDYNKPVCKEYCNQLLGATSWFRRTYSDTCTPTPILIHPFRKFQSEASPSNDMRVIDTKCLNDLKASVQSYVKAVTAGNQGFIPVEKFSETLHHFRLSENLFIQTFTTPAV